MWWPILSRLLAGTLGAYGTSYAVAGALAAILPLSRVDRVSVATCLSFVVMAVFCLGVGCTRRLGRVWAIMAGVTVCAYVIVRVRQGTL